MLPHISENINQTAMKTFGLKVKAKSKKHSRKLPMNIIKMIRTKAVLTKTISTAYLSACPEQAEEMEDQLNHLKISIKDALAGVGLQRRHQIGSKVLRGGPYPQFLKSQLKNACHINAVYDKTGIMVFEQPQIEGAVIDHFDTVFDGQRIPVFPTGPDPVSQEELAISE